MGLTFRPAGLCKGLLCCGVRPLSTWFWFFHESGELGAMLHKMCCASQGARAKLQAYFGRLGCTTSVPVLMQLFSTLVALAISYVCEVWGPQLLGRLNVDAK